MMYIEYIISRYVYMYIVCGYMKEYIHCIDRALIFFQICWYRGPKPSTSWTSDPGRITRNSMIMNRSALMRQDEREQSLFGQVQGPGWPHRKAMEMMNQKKYWVGWTCVSTVLLLKISDMKDSIRILQGNFQPNLRSNAIVCKVLQRPDQAHPGAQPELFHPRVERKKRNPFTCLKCL